MKPTQEQVLQWAREAGYGDILSMLHSNALGRLVALSYEAGRKDENEACAKVCEAGTGEPIQMKTLDILRKERERIAAAIRARREQ